MSGVLNDYNQQDGSPRILIRNWCEERALMATTGQSRGSTTAQKNDTATRITGPVTQPTDYTTTSYLAHQHTLRAPHGPTYINSIAPPRRNNRREEARLAEAAQIMADRARAAEERKEEELRYAAFGAREPMNRKRVIGSTKSLEESKESNPLHAATAITFHSHHLGSIHGTTPSDRGVHTFSRNSHFSKPISELHESGER
jgi:hypothetical protein